MSYHCKIVPSRNTLWHANPPLLELAPQLWLCHCMNVYVFSVHHESLLQSADLLQVVHDWSGPIAGRIPYPEQLGTFVYFSHWAHIFEDHRVPGMSTISLVLFSFFKVTWSETKRYGIHLFIRWKSDVCYDAYHCELLRDLLWVRIFNMTFNHLMCMGGEMVCVWWALTTHVGCHNTIVFWWGKILVEVHSIWIHYCGAAREMS